MSVATCFDCIHATINEGHYGSREEPPEPAHIEECNNDGVDETLFEKYDETTLPGVCRGFSPKMVENCTNIFCNKRIWQPEWSWGHFASTMYDRVPVCSTECKHAVEAANKLEQEK